MAKRYLLSINVDMSAGNTFVCLQSIHPSKHECSSRMSTFSVALLQDKEACLVLLGHLLIADGFNACRSTFAAFVSC